MKKIWFIVCIVCVQSLYANDGGVALLGGTLYPVDIDTVSMEYERLVITLKEGHFEIEAYIELYNHEPSSIEPLLGFEFYGANPFASWSYPYQIIEERTRQFALAVNDVEQQFEYKKRTEGEEANMVNIHTLVYKPQLNPGTNIVYHKHHLPYGSFAVVRYVSYILRTSSRWQGGIIKNMEIIIQSERNLMVQIMNDSFYRWTTGYFDTVGQSRRLERSRGSSDDEYILTPNGYLYKTMRNFIPDKNIYFQIISWYNRGSYGWYHTIYDWTCYIENNFLNGRWQSDTMPSEKMLEDVSLADLRIFRNTLYAMRGYIFNDSALNEHFNEQFWYFPDPSVTLNDIVFSDAEQQILHYIIAEENRR